MGNMNYLMEYWQARCQMFISLAIECLLIVFGKGNELFFHFSNLLLGKTIIGRKSNGLHKMAKLIVVIFR
jgi:hypothetical protein